MGGDVLLQGRRGRRERGPG